MMFDFFRKRAPKWNQLTIKQQANATARLSAIVRAMGAKYKIVSQPWDSQRERGQIEYSGEDSVLDVYSRGRLLDMARNAYRNSPTFDGMLKQIELNAIGSEGGKCVFPEGGEKIKEAFAKWTRNADFFDGVSFNQLLRLILKSYILGGDCVLLFDDGLIEDSGRVLLYESDEISNTTDEAIREIFGKGYTQSLGRVYSPTGRFSGVVVSRSQRGAEVFDPSKCYFLRKDPDAEWLDSYWMMPRNVFRPAQGRGISPCASSLGNTLDLEDLVGYEIAAAKKNAQTLATIEQDATKNETTVPSAFDTGVDFENMTDEELEQAIKQAQAQQPAQTVSLSRLQAAGALYEVLPEGYRLSLCDTKRPNPNMPDFVRWLATRSAAPFGLSQLYATLMADSSSSFRAQQILTWPSFYDCQHFLEQISDWTLWRWSLWAERRGEIDTSALGSNWLRRCSWTWPRMDEVDETSHENATALKLKNMTGTYKDALGPDWKEKLAQVQTEVEWCKAHNLPHPAYESVCGAERTGADVPTDKENVN